MPETTTIRILRSTAELQAFAAAWQRLWTADPYATPFQSPEWLLPWWRQFGRNDLRATVLIRGDEPICFLPFYVYEDALNRERKMMLMGVGTSDYLDGLFAPRCSAEEVLACVEAALDHDGWDTLNITQLRDTSKLLRALTISPAIIQFRTEMCSRMKAVAIASLPTKIRRNAMYYRNRARRRGSLQFTIADATTCGAQFEELVQLHTARWRESGQDGVLCAERVLAWHREAVPLLQAAGILRLMALRLDNETIALLYSLIDPPERAMRAQYFYLPAYSPAHADLRPGTLLLAEASEHAAAEGVTCIDMLRGHEQYKQLWHLEQVATTGVELRAREWQREVAA